MRKWILIAAAAVAAYFVVVWDDRGSVYVTGGARYATGAYGFNVSQFVLVDTNVSIGANVPLTNFQGFGEVVVRAQVYSASNAARLDSVTNVANAAIAPVGWYYTNITFAANMTVSAHKDARAYISVVDGDANILITNAVPGAGVRIVRTADSNPSTIRFYWQGVDGVIMLSTNGTVNETNMYVPPNKTGVAGITFGPTNYPTVICEVSP